MHLDPPSEYGILAAAAIKAEHTMAYAGAFATGTAAAHRTAPLTGDPEVLDEDAP